MVASVTVAKVCCVQALNLWLQYITLLGGINIPAPSTVHWVFAAAQFAFATVTSGSLSTDCLLTGPINNALQRMLIHLAVPGLMFLALSAIQVLRSPLGPCTCLLVDLQWFTSSVLVGLLA